MTDPVHPKKKVFDSNFSGRASGSETQVDSVSQAESSSAQMAEVGGKRALEKTEKGCSEGNGETGVDGEGDVESESKIAKVEAKEGEGPDGPAEAEGEQKSAKLKAEGVEDLVGGEPPETAAEMLPTPMPPCVESPTKAKPRLEVMYTFTHRGTDEVGRGGSGAVILGLSRA